ncbi:hypothetical protein [Alteripontixanthobacter muriae]|uniref:hypothetical protein n=1 Tax=Alteripontixanthobacter muriae TaxID=2705546 RepID=UPI0015758D10|nr:hypothetical protein [Alteripontixanthobacter muriae]
MLAVTFAAMGKRARYIVIVPSRDVVMVRRGEDPAGSRFDIAAFTRDVLERLPQDADRTEFRPYVPPVERKAPVFIIKASNVNAS